MDPASKTSAPDTELETNIVEFLRKHPEFFSHHPEVLAELHIPHPSGHAISLIERQIEALRGETTRYRGQIEKMLAVARTNDLLNQRLHRLTLALIDAADFTEVINTLEDHLHDAFKADAVELRLFAVTHPRAQAEGDGTFSAEPGLDAFMDFFQRSQPVCGRLTPMQMDFLFGAQAEEMDSAALLPLQSDDVMGVLAIGSTDAERFHPDMGTEFLVRLAEIVSHKLQVVSLPGV
jgi:uncharacterized protein YigA (DUF484 family)